MATTGKWLMIVKTLVKSSLDNYVLPGTLTGTEILLVYLHQWRRDISLAAAASLYLFLNQADGRELDEAVLHAGDGGRDMEEASL